MITLILVTYIQHMIYLNIYLAKEHGDDNEILLSMEHVRPGNGFQPVFELCSKVRVVA